MSASLLAASLATVLATSPATAVARNDYAKPGFEAALGIGMRDFYARDFPGARTALAHALQIVPDNTLAISFLDAAAAQEPGALDALTNDEEDAAGAAPKSYAAHVRLGFVYLFDSSAARDRRGDAREEFMTALGLDPGAAAAHTGLGILRFDERSANRAKLEFASALRADPSNVLALEYLGQLYQTDLHDPQRGLRYMIDVPNLVPQYADIQFHIGSLLADLGQDDAAIPYLRRGLALDTGHVGEAGQHGYTLLAQIYLRERKIADATAMLDAAVDADVDALYARTLLARIKNGDYQSAAPSPSPSS